MKKTVILFLIILIIDFTTNKSNIVEATSNNINASNSIMNSQKETLNISKFLGESENYTTEFLQDVDLNELLNSAISGNIDNTKLVKNAWRILGNEVANAATALGSILVIIIIHSIIKSISDGLKNQSVSQIAYYVQYILIVTIVMVNFADIIDMVRNSVTDLVSFINALLPILITLMLTTGSIASATMLQPIILFIITLVGNLITNVIIPIVLVSTALGIISQISDKIQIDKLSKFLKSTSIWILGILITIFVGVSSLEGSLTSSVDGLTAKTAKAAVSNCIPVVGKILGDSIETVIGCGGILKNAIGVIGVLIIIGICIVPIIKLTVLMTIYYIGAAICQPIADKKIIKLLEQMGDTFKILLGILCSVSVMLIVGVTLIIKISNTGAMYR